MKVGSASEIRSVGAGTVDADKASTPAAPAQPDKVTTTQSTQLAETVAAVQAQVGTGQSARLQQIEEAIRQGTYRPDPARIADQILQDADITAKLQAMLSK